MILEDNLPLVVPFQSPASSLLKSSSNFRAVKIASPQNNWKNIPTDEWISKQNIINPLSPIKDLSNEDSEIFKAEISTLLLITGF